MRGRPAVASGRIRPTRRQRISEQRIEEALSLGSIQYFVTACPKDYTMYTDAVKNLGKSDETGVVDLIELVAEAG